MIANRILEPGSKLAARALDAETRHSTLGEELKLERIDEDDLYEAMEWLGNFGLKRATEGLVRA